MKKIIVSVKESALKFQSQSTYGHSPLTDEPLAFVLRDQFSNVLPARLVQTENGELCFVLFDSTAANDVAIEACCYVGRLEEFTLTAEEFTEPRVLLKPVLLMVAEINEFNCLVRNYKLNSKGYFLN